jgi:hypothetical protein
MTRPVGLNPAPFAEQLRRAHCAHASANDPEHACVGRCTITREGVELNCKLCGNGGESLTPSEGEARDARAVVEAIGMSWSSLTPEAKRAAVAALLVRR